MSTAIDVMAPASKPAQSKESPQHLLSARKVDSPRLPELDGLRGVACLMVVLYHYGREVLGTSLYPKFETALQLMDMWWSGVDLFFVLSGFLLGGILLDHRGSPTLLRTFYIRRFCRIVPLYYVCLFTYFVVRSVLQVRQSNAWVYRDAEKPWVYFCYVQNIFFWLNNNTGDHVLRITWSLAVEEQFYLLLPFLILYIPTKWIPLLMIGLICLAPITRGLLYLYDPVRASRGCYVLLPARWDSLFFGVFGAWIVRTKAWRSKPPQHLVLFAAFGVLLVGMAAFSLRWPDSLMVFRKVVIFTWVAAFYLATILLTLTCHPLRRWVSNKLLIFFGSISYCVYLVHEGVVGTVHGWLRSSAPSIHGPLSAGLTAAAFILTVLIAVVSYRLIEAPIISVGRRFKY